MHEQFEGDAPPAWDEPRTLVWRPPPQSDPVTASIPVPPARTLSELIGTTRARIALVMLGATIVIAALAVIVVGVRHLRAASSAATILDDTPVPVALVTAAPPHRESRFFGMTRAVDHASLGFPLGGRLVAPLVRVGDMVHAGDVLARIDAAAYEAAAQAAAASQSELAARARMAERESDRLEQLARAGAASTRDVENAAAQSDALRASRRALAARARASAHSAEEGELVAPFDGVVTAVRSQVGEIVAPGAPVVVLSGAGAVETELLVPESAISPELAEGAVVSVAFPVLGDRGRAQGRVTHVARATSSGLYPIVVELPQGTAAGLTAEVTLPVPTRASLAVPVEAIVDPVGRQPRVIVVRRGRARFIDVEPYELVDGRVVVGGAIARHEIVVVGRHRLLLPGDTVRPVFDGRSR